MPDLQQVLDAVRSWTETFYHRKAVKLVISLKDGQRVSLPVPQHGIARAASDPFVCTPLQNAILDALAGKALRTDALAAKCGNDRSRLFKPGGLKELRDQGLVDHHPRMGYYRPDDPPPELPKAEGQDGAEG